MEIKVFGVWHVRPRPVNGSLNLQFLISSPIIKSLSVCILHPKPKNKRNTQQVHNNTNTMAPSFPTPKFITGGCLCNNLRYRVDFPADHDFENSVSSPYLILCPYLSCSSPSDRPIRLYLGI